MWDLSEEIRILRVLSDCQSGTVVGAVGGCREVRRVARPFNDGFYDDNDAAEGDVRWLFRADFARDVVVGRDSAATFTDTRLLFRLFTNTYVSAVCRDGAGGRLCSRPQLVRFAYGGSWGGGVMGRLPHRADIT